MSGIRYLIDDLDCLESCNSLPLASAAAAGMTAPATDFALPAGGYTGYDGAAAMGGGPLAAAGMFNLLSLDLICSCRNNSS